MALDLKSSSKFALILNKDSDEYRNRNDKFLIQGMPFLEKKQRTLEAGGSNWKEMATTQKYVQTDSDYNIHNKEYRYPDFGFNDELNHYSGETYNIWSLLFDHIKFNPKFERLKNIIEQLTIMNLQSYQ